MIHGARSALRAAQRKAKDSPTWLAKLADRTHPNIAAVALANKNARIAFALLAHGRDYQPGHVPVRMAA